MESSTIIAGGGGTFDKEFWARLIWASLDENRHENRGEASYLFLCSLCRHRPKSQFMFRAIQDLTSFDL